MNTTLYSLIAAATACGLASTVAQTAYTNPVGYMTVPIPGTSGVGTNKLQLANQGLLPSGPAASGGGASVTFSGTTMTDADAAFGALTNGGSNSHVLEITSASPVQGALSWITANTATTITTSDDLSSAGAQASYRVWATYTMATLFGNPPVASVLGGGGTELAADSVQILDPTTNIYTSFYYQSSGKGTLGWKSSNGSIVAAADYAIHPNDGLVILRKQSADGALVISGSVKTGPTTVLVTGDATPGAKTLNILANQIPVDQLTPGTSGLYTGNPATGMKGGGTELAADSLLIFDATTNSYTTFWYQDSGKGTLGWKSSDGSIAVPADHVIPATGALLLQRKAAASFNWTVPTVNAAQ